MLTAGARAVRSRAGARVAPGGGLAFFKQENIVVVFFSGERGYSL